MKLDILLHGAAELFFNFITKGLGFRMASFQFTQPEGERMSRHIFSISTDGTGRLLQISPNELPPEFS